MCGTTAAPSKAKRVESWIYLARRAFLSFYFCLSPPHISTLKNTGSSLIQLSLAPPFSRREQLFVYLCLELFWCLFRGILSTFFFRRMVSLFHFDITRCNMVTVSFGGCTVAGFYWLMLQPGTNIAAVSYPPSPILGNEKWIKKVKREQKDPKKKKKKVSQPMLLILDNSISTFSSYSI